MKYIFLILSLFLSVFSIFSSPVSASDSGYNGDNWYITMPMVLNSSTSSYSFGVSNNSTPFADKSRSLVLVNEQTSTNIDTMSYGPQILCVAPQKNEQTIVSKLSVRMLSYRTTADRTDADYSFDIDSGGNRFRSMPVLNRGMFLGAINGTKKIYGTITQASNQNNAIDDKRVYSHCYFPALDIHTGDTTIFRIQYPVGTDIGLPTNRIGKVKHFSVQYNAASNTQKDMQIQTSLMSLSDCVYSDSGCEIDQLSITTLSGQVIDYLSHYNNLPSTSEVINFPKDTATITVHTRSKK